MPACLLAARPNGQRKRVADAGDTHQQSQKIRPPPGVKSQAEDQNQRRFCAPGGQVVAGKKERGKGEEEDVCAESHTANTANSLVDAVDQPIGHALNV